MTSTEDVDVIRYGLREETDMRVCLLNYRKNGTAFLNQFNLSPLRDTEGKLVSRVLAPSYKYRLRETRKEALASRVCHRVQVPFRHMYQPQRDEERQSARGGDYVSFFLFGCCM